jgi:Tol biopolymer transport system component
VHVAFMSNRDGNWEIYLLALQDQTMTRLTDNPARDGSPVFSPDGGRVAFVSDRGGEWGIWSLDWQKPGSEKLLLAIPGGIEGPVTQVSAENQPGWVYESISWRKK